MDWQLLPFSQLSLDQLYEILSVRQSIFIVEQQCPYMDADGLDQYSYHLIGRDDDGALVAYVRILPPGLKYAEPSIGRVLTVKRARRSGLGKALMREAIEGVRRLFPGQPIRIGAQRYLERFYTELGFHTISEPYDEDGIPHVEMRLSVDQFGP